MNDTILIVGIVAVCLGTLYAGVWFAFRNMDKIVAQYRLLANQYNFELEIPSKWSWFVQDYPTARGTYQDLPIVVDMFSIGTEQLKKTYSRVWIDKDYSDLPDFVLTTMSLHSVVEPIVSYTPILSGNTIFDGMYQLQGASINKIERIFDANLQDRLLQQTFVGTVAAQNGRLYFYTQYGMLHEGQREMVEKGMQCLVEVARKVELLNQ